MSNLPPVPPRVNGILTPPPSPSLPLSSWLFKYCRHAAIERSQMWKGPIFHATSTAQLSPMILMKSGRKSIQFMNVAVKIFRQLFWNTRLKSLNKKVRLFKHFLTYKSALLSRCSDVFKRNGAFDLIEGVREIDACLVQHMTPLRLVGLLRQSVGISESECLNGRTILWSKECSILH